MPEFTFSDKTLEAIEQILADIFSEELRRLEELEKINQKLEGLQKLEELEKINQSLEELPRINQSLKKITLILEKIGRTKGIDV